MKILVADDDLGSLLVVQSVVQALGHECLTAPDGTAAWELFEQHAPDVLILDRSMPGLDGVELCRRVRSAADAAYTYVVLLTGHGRPQDVLSGMRAGADDYLAKPLDPLALEGRLLAARRVTELHAELARTRTLLHGQAHTDPLTGLRNRLSLTADLEEVRRRSERYGRDWCVALCDVDFFKRYNDTYGHPAGDSALRTVSATLVEHLRDVDVVYRYGGEEFLVLLPEQAMSGAAVALERVRRALVAAAVPHVAAPSGVLTMSIGVAGCSADRPQSAETLIAAADAALYQAKADGRNRLHRHQPVPDGPLVAPGSGGRTRA